MGNNTENLLLPDWVMSKYKQSIMLVKYANNCKYVITFLPVAKSYSAKFGSSSGNSYELPYQLTMEEHRMIHNLLIHWGWIK